jgi:PHS family inorganic phosphate transporter-like MFS transporter
MQNASPCESTLLLGGPPKGRLWPTVSLIGATGLALVADGYDMSSIDLVVAILSKLHDLDPKDKSISVTALLVGVMIGQLFFGATVDLAGRRLCSIVTAVITMVGAAMSACIVHTDAFPLVYQLAICRFVLGLGIGGEYPVTAAISAEAYSSPTFKGVIGSPFQLLLTNMLCLKVGQMLTPLVVLMLMATGMKLDAVWRLSLGIGMIPSCIALFFRLHMQDTLALEEVKQVIDQHADAKDTTIVRSIHRSLRPVWERFSIVLGACIVWCMGNVVSYGMGAYKSLIAEEIFGTSAKVEETIHRDAIFAMFFTSFPVAAYIIIFYWLGMHPSCFRMQVILFGGLAISFTLAGFMAVSLPSNVHLPLVVLLMVVATLSALTSVPQYCLLPQHIPAVARGTSQGIASFGGKFGATLGTAAVPFVTDAFGLHGAFVVYAVASLVGLLSTFLLTPRFDGDPENVDKLPLDDDEKKL